MIRSVNNRCLAWPGRQKLVANSDRSIGLQCFVSNKQNLRVKFVPSARYCVSSTQAGYPSSAKPYVLLNETIGVDRLPPIFCIYIC